MCGFLFVEAKSCQLSETLDDALHTMQRRGPDAHHSQTIDNRWYLGHQRLKVVDLDARSDQPFWSEDGRHAILFNGEVYNYQDLAAKYRLSTHTTSDTEVLLLLYRELGPRMLTELNGMFAFLIFDRISGDTFAARDRLGVKPLYVYEDARWRIWASEVAPILKVAGDLPLSAEGMRQYRALRTFFNGRTAYEGIEMFGAGTYELHGQRTRYWELPRGNQTAPDDDELRSLIADAVKIRTVADVPVGSLLSGGIDSTIVAALSHKPDTWTVGFTEMNEFDWSALAADHIGSRHTALEITDEDFFRALRELTVIRREPLSVPNEVSLYLLALVIKRSDTVILSGEGADELFFGYDRIFRWAAASATLDVPGFATRYAYGDSEDLEIIESVLAPFLDRGSALDVVAAFFQIAHLHGLLRRLDGSTMAASVEARPPFCDFRLVDRMAGVSCAYRMSNGTVKAPLKRIFGNVVPAAIVDRPKVGFPLPLRRLFPGAATAKPTAAWLSYAEDVFTSTGRTQ